MPQPKTLKEELNDYAAVLAALSAKLAEKQPEVSGAANISLLQAIYRVNEGRFWLLNMIGALQETGEEKK